MPEKEIDWDSPIVEAIEKVVRAPAKQPTLSPPDASITKGLSIGTTGITILQSLPPLAKFIPGNGVTIGKDAETGIPVTVTDKERECAGLVMN